MVSSRIHPVVWWIVPALLLAGTFLSEILVPIAEKPAFFSEGGPIEILQEIFLIIAIVYAVRLFMTVDGLWMKIWFCIAALSCIYVAGEEVSWGQHYFGWGTPEFWEVINDQQETNLHNTSPWLDQKPKILLQLGVLVGGLIIPAFLKWNPAKLPPRFSAIYPDKYVVVTALFALGVKLLETVQDNMSIKLLWRPSEVLELYIYYFVMIYLVVMWKRFAPSRTASIS